MDFRSACCGIALTGALFALSVLAADNKPPVGSIATRPIVPLDSEAMQAMMRADRDKDGVLSREELEHYDMGLARRFKEVDADRDGKLTFYEFEKLLAPPETSASRR